MNFELWFSVIRRFAARFSLKRINGGDGCTARLFFGGLMMRGEMANFLPDSRI
jgi:hypothetical protein